MGLEPIHYPNKPSLPIILWLNICEKIVASIQLFLTLKKPKVNIGTLTGDVEEGLSFRWRSDAIIGLATIPSDVFLDDTRYNEASVGKYAGPRHQSRTVVNVSVVMKPLICDVVRVSLRQAVQLHAGTLGSRCIRRRNQNVDVSYTSNFTLNTFSGLHRIYIARFQRNPMLQFVCCRRSFVLERTKG